MNHSPRRLCHRGAYWSVRASQKQPPLRGRAAATEVKVTPLRSVAIKRPPSLAKPIIVQKLVHKTVKTVLEPPSLQESTRSIKPPDIKDDKQDFVLPKMPLRYGNWWMLLIALIGCLAIALQLR